VIQETCTAEDAEVISLRLGGLNISEPGYSKVEHSGIRSKSYAPFRFPHTRGLALPISAWGIGEHAMHQLLGCRSAAETVRELPLRAGLKRCGVAEAGGRVTSRCFGWAGFQMLRFAQHDSPLSFPATAHDGGTIIWPGGKQRRGGAVAVSQDAGELGVA